MTASAFSLEAMTKAGTYHYKITGLKASPYGENAEGMPDCEGKTMNELEDAIVAACHETSGFPKEAIKYMNSVITPKVALWTACIGTAKIGGGGGGGGGGGAVAAAGGGAAAAAAPEPEPEPEEEEEDMGFDLFD